VSLPMYISVTETQRRKIENRLEEEEERRLAIEGGMSTSQLTMGALIATKNQRLKRTVRATDTSATPLVEHWSFDRVCALLFSFYVSPCFPRKVGVGGP